MENDPKTSNKFKGQVLRQVYRVWLFRKLLPVVVAEVAGFAVVLYVLSRTVFVQKVFENALSVVFASPSEILSFGFSAFFRAPILTQVLSIAVALLLAFVIRHITQGFLRLILVRENYFERVTK